MTTSRDDSQTVVRAMASDGAGQPTFADCRTAARAVHEADLGRRLSRTCGPVGCRVYSVPGRPWRSSCAWRRSRAGCCGGLRRLSPCSSRPATTRARGGSPWLRWLDRWWDPLLFAVPSVILLGAAALLALPEGAAHWRVITALVSVLAVLGYVAVLVTAVAVRGFVSLYRTLILGRSKEVTESGIGQVLASHWSIPFANSPRRTPTR